MAIRIATRAVGNAVAIDATANIQCKNPQPEQYNQGEHAVIAMLTLFPVECADLSALFHSLSSPIGRGTDKIFTPKV